MVTTQASELADKITEPYPIRNATLLKDSRGYTTFRVVNIIVLFLIMFVTLYPFINIVAQSFSSEGFINSGQVNLYPRGFNVETYKTVMADSMFWTNYRNTVVYTVVGTVIALVMTTMFAYALSKKHLKGETGSSSLPCSRCSSTVG